METRYVVIDASLRFSDYYYQYWKRNVVADHDLVYMYCT